jgi:SAM-dependent methyltransferase
MLDLRVGRHGSPGFDPHFFESLQKVEEQHFWFVGRRETVLGALRLGVPDWAKRRLFDIGCGTGGLLAFLGSNGIPLAGACDAYPESLRLVRARLDLPLVLVDEGRLPPLGQGYDLLGMFDVLEHLDDDVGTLHSLAEALVPGGALVLTVPAHPWLFDEMDVLACHRRRYTRAGLRRALEEAGFEVLRLGHFMSPTVPALLLIRALGRLLPGGRANAVERRQAELRVLPGFNGMMRGILAIERGVATLVSLPFGSSLIAVAARPK